MTIIRVTRDRTLALARLLARQDGLIDVAQARELGISASGVQRRVASGRWRRVAPQVFLVSGYSETPATRIRRAALWSAPHGVVSGEAAAWWLGIHDRPPPITSITLPRTSRRTPPELIGIRRRDLDPRDVMIRRGVRVTSVALSALETATLLSTGGELLDRVLQRGLVDWRTLYATFCRAVGSRGATRMQTLIIAAADRADSAAERKLKALLRAAGIDGWVCGLDLGWCRLDLAFPGQKIVVEVDGWAWHHQADRFQRDRERQNALVQRGWLVLRFTWHDLDQRPDDVIAQIRFALRRR